MPLPIHSVVLSFTAATLLILSGCGGGSSQTSNTDPAPTTNPVASLAAPAAVAVTTDAGQVTLQWEPVAGATSYAIYLAVPASSAALVSKVKHAEAASSPYMVNGLSRGQTYLFTIVAITATGNEGTASAEITVHLPMTATALATGAEHSCALLADGVVKCWGRNHASQLGSAVGGYAASPVAVPGIANAKAISAAGQHSCAVLMDGSMQCWGTYGESGTAVTFTSPIVIGGITSAVSVTSSRDTDCALLRDATVACFSPVAISSTPTFAPSLSKVAALAPVGTIVSGVANVKQIAAGADFTCALLNDGTVTCWNGVVGNLGYAPAQPVPHIVAATAIAARGDQACALMPASVQCWKSVATVSMFNMPLNFMLTEVQDALSGIKTIAVGAGVTPFTYFAMMEDGTVQVWGVDGMWPTASSEVAVTAVDTVPWNSSGTVVARAPASVGSWTVDNQLLTPQITGGTVISEGGADTLQAIWVGQSVTGGTFTVVSAAQPMVGVAILVITPPTRVADLANVTAIANGNTHGCALLLSGDVTCWGDNQYGQLGNGETSAGSAAPALIKDL